jgi:hypothetical protein
MAYIIQDRATGKYLSPAPYKGFSERYTKDRSDARQFSRYVEAFNSARSGEMVLEI